MLFAISYRWEAVVAAVWAAMTALACVYVVRYGQDLPRQDEWEFVPVLYGMESRWDWVWSRHYEHRYPLGRALYLGLDALTGHDHRAGLWVSVALLSSSAFLLVRAAKQLRGRSDPIDVFLPVLLMNAGHCENLTMGYQIAFTLTTFSVAVALWIMSRASELGLSRSGLWIGTLGLLVVPGGGIGLVFAVPLVVWVVTQAVRGCVRRSWWLLLCPLVVAGYAGFTTWEAFQAPPTTQRNDLEATLWQALEFLTQGLGGVGRLGWPVLGILFVMIQVDVAVTLAIVVIRRPQERPFALGCLCVLLGVWLVALAVGHSRPTAAEFRYTTPSCLAGCVCLLAAARYGRRLAGPGAVFVLAVAALVAYYDWQFGKQFGDVYRLRYAALRADIAAGVPADLLADRHTFYPGPTYRANFRTLYDRGNPALRDAAPPRALKAVELPLVTGARIPALDPARSEGPPALEFTLPQPRRVCAVRIHYDNDDSRYIEVFQLTWHGEQGPRYSAVFPWLVPESNALAFWIDDTVTGFSLRVVRPSKGLAVTRVELLVDGE